MSNSKRLTFGFLQIVGLVLTVVAIVLFVEVFFVLRMSTFMTLLIISLAGVGCLMIILGSKN